MPGRVSLALRLYFCLPGALGALALWMEPVGAQVAGATSIAAALLVLIGRVGKWAGFLVIWFFWIAGGLLVAVTFPLWPVMIGCTLLVWTACFAATRIGRTWGAGRAARLAARGRGIRECEWVFTGADYVAGHPLNRLSFGLWASAAAFALATALVIFDLALGLAAPWEWALAAVFALPIWPILARQPVAYPMVFGAGLAAVVTLSPVLMALMLPVCFYWADGVRPNLIYRHRFERLLPGGARDV
ncbi:hypothetical protein [Hasllibacter sp. MH4015]|uniref:hypothetical protein n=1 Tax=Hasllibacter sp. MH4015 TaxID=2854029 RepID=UPI001CD6B650|nr:hypothetical protein [Hasllibacter sp. MH4015]